MNLSPLTKYTLQSVISIFKLVISDRGAAHAVGGLNTPEQSKSPASEQLGAGQSTKHDVSAANRWRHPYSYQTGVRVDTMFKIKSVGLLKQNIWSDKHGPQWGLPVDVKLHV